MKIYLNFDGLMYDIEVDVELLKSLPGGWVLMLVLMLVWYMLVGNIDVIGCEPISSSIQYNARVYHL